MSTIETEIRKTMKGMDEALLANDADAVGRFMADTWIYVGPQGIATKAEIIGHIASGRLAHTAFEAIGQERIVVHGGLVLVTGHRRTAGTWDGVPYTTDEWLSEAYEKTGDRWLCVLSHKSDVA